MAQNSAVWRPKLEEMINWKTQKMVDRTCVVDMLFLHKDFVSEARLKWMCFMMYAGSYSDRM